MYNELISEGKKIYYSIVSEDEVVFCGVPEEYEDFRKSELNKKC